MEIRTEVIHPGREVNVLYTIDVSEGDPVYSLFFNGAVEVSATIEGGIVYRYTRVETP